MAFELFNSNVSRNMLYVSLFSTVLVAPLSSSRVWNNCCNLCYVSESHFRGPRTDSPASLCCPRLFQFSFHGTVLNNTTNLIRPNRKFGKESVNGQVSDSRFKILRHYCSSDLRNNKTKNKTTKGKKRNWIHICVHRKCSSYILKYTMARKFHKTLLRQNNFNITTVFVHVFVHLQK